MYLLCKGQLEIYSQHATGVDGEVTAASVQAVWEMFCTKNQNFPSKYKVYCHFKEKG
jgi:hypothetical protein